MLYVDKILDFKVVLQRKDVELMNLQKEVKIDAKWVWSESINALRETNFLQELVHRLRQWIPRLYF